MTRIRILYWTHRTEELAAMLFTRSLIRRLRRYASMAPRMTMRPSTTPAGDCKGSKADSLKSLRLERPPKLERPKYMKVAKMADFRR